MKLLLIDNFDSFTYNIRDYLARLGATVQVVSRLDCRLEQMDEADGIVFSPGPGNPESIPQLTHLISSAVSRKPVLGICLGHQALALHFGSSLKKADPFHGKFSEVQKVADSPYLAHIPEKFRVVRYHSLIVDVLSADLRPLLRTKDGILMAFYHCSLPLLGIQFHPEAHLTEYGLPLLSNWLDSCQLSKK